MLGPVSEREDGGPDSFVFCFPGPWFLWCAADTRQLASRFYSRGQHGRPPNADFTTMLRRSRRGARALPTSSRGESQRDSITPYPQLAWACLPITIGSQFFIVPDPRACWCLKRNVQSLVCVALLTDAPTSGGISLIYVKEVLVQSR